MIADTAEYCRNKMHDCRHLAAQTEHPSMKTAWLLVADQWEKLAARFDLDQVTGISNDPSLSIATR
jgi:hypothetical protein